MAELTIKLDETLKEDVETLFGQMGLNVSDAIKLFFAQSLLEKALPFTPPTETDDEEYNRYFNPVNLARLAASEESYKKGNIIKFTEEEWAEYTK